MSPILERIMIVSAIIGLLAIYGLVGADDLKAAEIDAAHTAEIIARAKQDAAVEKEWARLNAWGEQFVVASK